jgi:hypothetical protein
VVELFFFFFLKKKKKLSVLMKLLFRLKFSFEFGLLIMMC